MAFELIGKVLVFCENGITLQGRVVETEAYLGSGDPASHAYCGITPRNRVMFGEAGVSYVYFTYGNHHCLNVVTEREGIAGAVLIRGVEPLGGIELMRERRGTDDLRNLASGPGKLTQAFGITREHSGLKMTHRHFHFAEDFESKEDLLYIGTGPRIGISAGKEFPFRYFLEASRFVSVNPKVAHGL